MMSHYRYILQPYGNGRNTRFACPNCNRKKQFTRYLDTETGDYLHETVGICNRINKCGYHYTPKQFYTDNPWLATGLETESNGSATALQPHGQRFGNIKQPQRKRSATKGNTGQQPVSLVSVDKFRESRRNYGKNNFALFLQNRFGKEAAEQLIMLYHIGTSRKWPGATVFWQIDRQARIRAGKIMLYQVETGKRVKHPFDHITWVHSVLRLKDYRLSQCLFGEHLLRQFPDKPVAVVESEKTAIICSAYMPRYIWLATGSKGNLSRERCLVLRGRNVTLFPDLNGYEGWKAKAEEMADISSFTVSDILERIANEEQRKEGLDLADFI